MQWFNEKNVELPWHSYWNHLHCITEILQCIMFSYSINFKTFQISFLIRALVQFLFSRELFNIPDFDLFLTIHTPSLKGYRENLCAPCIAGFTVKSLGKVGTYGQQITFRNWTWKENDNIGIMYVITSHGENMN